MCRAVLFAVCAAPWAFAAPIAPVQAQESAAEGWSGEAELGFVVTGGNTDTETFNTKIKLSHEAAPWRHTGRLDVLKGSDNGDTNADRVAASVKTDRSLDDASYLYGLLNYEDDEFSGYDYRASESVGYGRRLLRSDAVSLNVEAGFGARQSELSATGENQDEGIVRVAGLLEWAISDATRFTQELDSETGSDFTVTRSLSALSAQIAGNLAAKFTVRVSHTSDVPPGVDKTDTETSTTLVYKF